MPLALPAFTFVIGPPKSGRTTLTRLLAETDDRLAMASIEEPLREAILQIFFPEQIMMGLDLREEDVLKTPLPLLAASIGDFKNQLKTFLYNFSPHILGDIAKRRASFIFANSFSRIAYDDAEGPDDLAPFVLTVGVPNCRLLFIERSGLPLAPYLKRFSGTFIPKTIVKNEEGAPSKMLEFLDSALGQAAAPKVAVPTAPSLGDL